MLVKAKLINWTNHPFRLEDIVIASSIRRAKKMLNTPIEETCFLQAKLFIVRRGTRNS